MDQKISSSEISAIILAGGRGSRMGGRDKGLVLFRGKPMVQWVSHAVGSQVGEVLVSANRNQRDYVELGFKVITDVLEDFQGPLAGIAAALAGITTRYVLTVPVDTPILPSDLVDRLAFALVEHNTDMAVVEAEGRLQATHMLFRASLADSLSGYLAGGGRRVQDWINSQRHVAVPFLPAEEHFRNINTESGLS